MAAKLSALAAQIVVATPATVATAIGGAITAADVTALVDLLKTLSLDNTLAVPALMKTGLANLSTALVPG